MKRSSLLALSWVFSIVAGCSSPGPGGGDAAADSRGDTVVPTDTHDASTMDIAMTDVVTTDATDTSTNDVTTGTDATDTTTAPDALDVTDVTSADVTDGSTVPDVASDGTSQPDAVDVASVDVATGGTCGGRGGRTCASGEFCNYALADICGRADATGVCTPVPTVCPDVVMPVCGCDGMDYTNECEANRAGVSVSSTGMCPMADCRTTGCPSGQYCSLCWVGYACIPVGAVC